MPRPPTQKEVVDFVTEDFQEFNREYLQYENEIKSRIREDSNKEPLDIDKLDLKFSPFIPTFLPDNFSEKKARSLSVAALILELRDRKEGNARCKDILESKQLESASAIGYIIQRFEYSRSQIGYDLVIANDRKGLGRNGDSAYFCRPGEYDLDIAENVMARFPSDYPKPSGKLYRYFQHLLPERFDRKKDGGSLNSRDIADTVSHEVTHQYIDSKFSGSLMESQKNNSSLIAFDEGAAYAVTYCYKGSFDFDATYHRDVEGVNVEELETAAQTFLEMTKDMETSKRIEKIREIAIRAIEECYSESNFEVLDEFVSGEMRENYQKIRLFNSSRQEIMQRFSESLYVLGFVSEDDLPKNVQISGKGMVQSDLTEMKNIAEDIISDHQDEAIKEIFEDLKKLMSLYRGSKEELHQDFLKLEEKDLDSIEDVKEDHFGRFVVTERDLERINQDLKLYDQFAEVALDSLNQIREVLYRLHEEEKVESSNVDSKKIRKLLELTEESLELVNNCIEDLEEAEEEIEEVRAKVNN